MLEFLRSWVINIITLAILITLLEILIPSGKIKKVVHLVSGFILMIAIINPVLGVLKKGVDLQDIQLADSNYIDKKEIEANSKVLQEKQMKQIVETYRMKIVKQVEDQLKDIDGLASVKADAMIYEDYEAQNFGEIKRVYLNIALRENSGGAKPVTKIEKVVIGGSETQGIKEAGREPGSEIRNQVEKRISGLLGIQKENIIIQVTGG